MDKRTCTIAGCEREHRSRGLCGSHYNQTYLKNRHKKKLVSCAFCGKEVERWGGGGRKNGPVCSYQCRQWLITPYSVLPKDHWARWYGKSSAWSPPKPKRVEVDCRWCGLTFMPTRVGARYCTRTCIRKASRNRRRAREHSAPGEYTWSQVIRLHLLSDKRCAYCDELTSQPEPDHVVPISRGGRNDLSNILPCCHVCNGDKGDMTLDEWRDYRERRGKAEVRTVFDNTDKRFIHLMHGVATGESQRIKTEMFYAAQPLPL